MRTDAQMYGREPVADAFESIAIGQQWEGDVRVVLFVVLRDGVELDDALSERIRSAIHLAADRLATDAMAASTGTEEVRDA